MSLNEINEKLYKKDIKEDLSAHEASQFNPEAAAPQAPPLPKADDMWQAKKKGLDQSEKKAVKRGLWALGAVLFIIIGTFIFYQIRRWSFSEGGASVSISGPEQAKSGKLLVYEISYKNDNWVSINNAEIRISYPEDFKPEENVNFKEESSTSGTYYIGTIKRHTEGKVVFNGKAYSPKGSLIYLKADLSYQPSNYSSKFVSRYQVAVNVISAPINLEIQGPQNISSGDAVDYLINYRNEGAEPIPSFKIRIEYPEQFTFGRSEPVTSESNNIWYVGALDPAASGKIVISGKLEGDQGKIKVATAYAGTTQNEEFVVFNEAKAETKIISSAFSISQSVNNLERFIANPGDLLRFRIAYQNDSGLGLRDVIVTEQIKGEALDYKTLDIPGGRFDWDEKTITWKAADFPALKNLGPGQGGSISFTVKVRDKLIVENEDDKNFVITSLAKIDSPDVPTPISMNKIISSNEMDIPVNTKIFIDSLGFYNDGVIPNQGPVPPKVGQETTYTIHWKVSNVSNDVSDAKVTAILPTDAVMTGKISPENARVTYNERENRITWEIGNMKAGVGILNSPLEAIFQLRIKPSPQQVGREVGLIGEALFQATDTFTKEKLEKRVQGKTTNLLEDKELTGEGKVTE